MALATTLTLFVGVASQGLLAADVQRTFMQAMGLVNDHLEGCHVRVALSQGA